MAEPDGVVSQFVFENSVFYLTVRKLFQEILIAEIHCFETWDLWP